MRSVLVASALVLSSVASAAGAETVSVISCEEYPLATPGTVTTVNAFERYLVSSDGRTVPLTEVSNSWPGINCGPALNPAVNHKLLTVRQITINEGDGGSSDLAYTEVPENFAFGFVTMLTCWLIGLSINAIIRVVRS